MQVAPALTVLLSRGSCGRNRVVGGISLLVFTLQGLGSPRLLDKPQQKVEVCHEDWHRAVTRSCRCNCQVFINSRKSCHLYEAFLSLVSFLKLAHENKCLDRSGSVSMKWAGTLQTRVKACCTLWQAVPLRPLYNTHALLLVVPPA